MALFIRIRTHQFVASTSRFVVTRKIIPFAGISTSTRLCHCKQMSKSTCSPLQRLMEGRMIGRQVLRRNLWGMLNAVFNRPDRYRIEEVGPHRACAEWLLRCGAHVRWQGIDKFQKDYNTLPSGPYDKFMIEEVNADNAAVMAIGFAHFQGINTIKKMRFHHCGYFYDDAISELAQLKDSLEHLEISTCGDVSDKGLAALAELTNLKTLILYDLPGVRYKEDALRKLQSALPDCDINFEDV